jgi:hypothetical protein
MALVTLAPGSWRGRNVHALKAAVGAAAVGVPGTWIPIWFFVSVSLAC